jgi:hypothetical protein
MTAKCKNARRWLGQGLQKTRKNRERMGHPPDVFYGEADAAHEERSFDSLSDPDWVATTLAQDDSVKQRQTKLKRDSSSRGDGRWPSQTLARNDSERQRQNKIRRQDAGVTKPMLGEKREGWAPTRCRLQRGECGTGREVPRLRFAPLGMTRSNKEKAKKELQLLRTSG